MICQSVVRVERDPIKIMFVSPSLSVGGAEMMLLKLVGAIDKRRFDTVVVSLMAPGPVGDMIAAVCSRVVGLNIKAGRMSLRGLWALCNLIKAEKPDLLQGWMYHGNLAAHLASLLVSRAKPVVWSIRAANIDLRTEKLATAATIWMGARFSRGADAIVNNAAFSAALHSRFLGYSRSNVVVIPNGFDTEVFRPDVAARMEIRRLLGVDSGAMLVGLVGRVEPVKDHSTFLRAAALVKQRFPQTIFVLIGQGADASNLELMALIRGCRLEHAVRLLGLRNDIPRLTAALDVAVLSSISEGFPNVVGEAMSCGIPVVSTAVGDAAELVGSSGFVVPPRRPDMLARAMEDILAMEAEQRVNLGKLARARIIERYSLQSVARQYEELYERLLVPSTMPTLGA
jgi:glycosyltransferase involved in cell wall biosynthesis